MNLDVIDNKIYVSSLEIARVFEKRHDNIIKSIESLPNDSFRLLNFEVSEEVRKNGIFEKPTKYYNLTRDGFSLLVMSFTGSKAYFWKTAFIDAFNKMESQLKTPKIPENYIQALELALTQAKTINALEYKIQNDKPLVTFAKTVTDASNAISIGEFAKLLFDENIKIGQNRLFKYLRENKYLLMNNQPYQEYLEKGYFKLIESTYETSYGQRIATKTLITGKGQIYFTEKLKRDF
ncbi:hypothetical protein BKH42_06920 [Helicobacter sp. 13S00482-2]|nr:hypothetical protein BKH42_06920 [Helicobacter sp. 13S00482-2]